MKKQLILLLLVCIFMVTTFVVAQPPFQESGGMDQLTIDFPKFDYTPYRDVTYFFNVYSINGIRLDNSTISCTGQLYSNTFGFLAQENLTFNETTGNFGVELLKDDLILNEWYHYDMFCSNSTVGGFVSSSFQTTHKGENSVPQSEGLFYLPIAYMLFIISLIMLYHYLDEEHVFIRTLIVFLLPALFVAVTGYSLKLANSFVGSSTALWFFRFSNWFSYIFGFYFVVAIYLSLRKRYKKKKNKH